MILLLRASFLPDSNTFDSSFTVQRENLLGSACEKLMG